MILQAILDQPWYLHAAVFGASLLQGASGIGFGIIAGPIILIALNDGSAIQVSVLLSFLIAVILSPAAMRTADTGFVKSVGIGTLIGAPAGIAVFAVISLAALKLLAAAAAFFMALMASGALKRFLAADHDSTGRQIATGIVSGAMSSSLAMPGPAVAAYMAAIRRDKLTVRGTTLAVFLYSYPIAYLTQLPLAKDPWAAVALAAALAPATVLGVIASTLIIRLLSQGMFRMIIVVVLFATAAALVYSA